MTAELKQAAEERAERELAESSLDEDEYMAEFFERAKRGRMSSQRDFPYPYKTGDTRQKVFGSRGSSRGASSEAGRRLSEFASRAVTPFTSWTRQVLLPPLRSRNTAECLL